MIRTFIDSGVLVLAARETDTYSEKALEILEDSSREFACSIFVRLEVLPKAIYNRRANEAQFYREYFDSVQYWSTNFDKLLQDAEQVAGQYGLAALDALHVAAALSVGAEELITTEKRTKPMHLVSGVKIISILN